jgi:APA family basic amino acid/polyamine antiporter
VISGIGEMIMMILKVTPMVLIPILTLPFWNTDILTTPSLYSPWESINSTTMLTFWGFVGLEGGTTIARMVNNPEKTLPKALFWGTGCVLFIYVLNIFSIMSVIPCQTLTHITNPYAHVLMKILPTPYHGIVDRLIHGIIALMCLGTVNSWTLASGNVAMTSAQEGLFSPWFRSVNRYGSPVRGIFVSSLCMLAFVLAMHSKGFADQINIFINISSLAFILIYFVCLAALVYLIKATPECKHLVSFSLKGSILISCIFSLWALASSSLWMVLGVIGIPLSGWIVARLMRWPLS